MKQGMLWYDNQSNVGFEKRINSALEFFESKYGYLPEKCFVHPDTLEEPLEMNQNVKILTNDRVMANHIWLEFSLE
jgi:hypothetical protein